MVEALEDRYLLNAGALDPTFGISGLVRTDFLAGTDEARAIVARSDGKLVVVGYAALGTEDSHSEG